MAAGRFVEDNWRWGLAFLVWGVSYSLLLLATVATSSERLLTPVWLLGCGGLAVTLLVWLGWSTPRPVVGRGTAGLALLVGIVVGILVGALPWNGSVSTLGQTRPVAAAVEETLHLGVPLVVFVAGVLPERRAGAVLGALVGASSGIVAGLVRGPMLPTAGLDALDIRLLAESIVLPCWHLAWTGLFGAILWRQPSRYAAMTGITVAAFLLLGVVLHLAGGTYGPLARSVVTLAALLGLVVVAGRPLGD